MRHSHMRAATRRALVATGVLAAFALVGGPGFAATRHAVHKHRHPVAHQLGMRAVIDPATGRLAPSVRVSDAPGTVAATPLAPLAAPGAVTPGAQPVVRTLQDGTQIVTVPPDQMEYEVARVGKDGKLERTCVHGNPKAATFAPRREAQ